MTEKTDDEIKKEMYEELAAEREKYLPEGYKNVMENREFPMNVRQYWATFQSSDGPLKTLWHDKQDPDLSEFSEDDWGDSAPGTKVYRCYAKIHGVPFLPGTRIVETMEQLVHEDNKSVISIEVKTLDTPVSSFYYYKTVWMVIGRPGKNFSAYGRLMKVSLSDYNPFKDIIIRKTLDGLVESENDWWTKSVNAGYMVPKPEFDDPNYKRLEATDKKDKPIEKTPPPKVNEDKTPAAATSGQLYEDSVDHSDLTSPQYLQQAYNFINIGETMTWQESKNYANK